MSQTFERAVVTGGAGFVGRRLVELLAGEPQHPDWPRFSSVHVLDTQPLEPVAQPTRATVTSGIGDIRSRADLREAFAGADCVFHTASVVDVSLRPHPRIDEINVAGTRAVLETCAELGVPDLVYTSSEDVLLSETPVRGGDETMPYPADPIHAYVRTKIAGERLVLEAHSEALRTCSLRPVHIYGPRDPHALIASLEAFADGTVPFLLGDGSARFDVVYVDNVAHAHLLAATKLREGVAGGRAYFVTEDHAPNYFDWLRPYADDVGVKMPRWRLGRRRTHLLARAMEVFHRVTGREVPFHSFHAHVIGEDFFFATTRARDELGYTPLVERDEAFRRTTTWLRKAFAEHLRRRSGRSS